MIAYCSKELMKVESNIDEIDLTKLQSHEILGFYLIGEISFGKLVELLEVDYQEARMFVSGLGKQVEDFSNKDDENVEVELW